jgi:hypothetical protein
MRDDKKNDRELGLLIHSIVKLFSEDYGRESFQTWDDTGCSDIFACHYEDLRESHYSDRPLYLYEKLLNFVEMKQILATVERVLPYEFILLVFIEEYIASGIIDDARLKNKLDSYLPIDNVVQDVADCFQVPKETAELALATCGEEEPEFRYLSWARFSDSLEEIVEMIGFLAV